MPKILLHGEGYYIFKFKSEEDKEKVINYGPYYFSNRPLILKPWVLDFEFDKEILSVVPIWVKFLGLPVGYWSIEALSKISSVVGRPMHTYLFTTNMENISYARILIEVDVLQPLTEVISIETPSGLWEEQVEYEWRPRYCNECLRQLTPLRSTRLHYTWCNKQSIESKDKKLLQDIEKWSKVEEQVLRHKARALWVESGDGNSKYFHAQWKMSRSQNTITSIYTESNIKLTDPRAIENVFISVFSGLMGDYADELPCVDTIVVRDRECITVQQQKELIREVSQMEIIDAVKSMPKEKALGVDGFPIEFQ
ncbi:hypothetical protein H5410_062161 [Solanum commersonii]|uniref:DUF4283 domain-containing protein n=2 Tax=Solanum TaxID=4107 RepID=A0A9J5W9N5_SOLCO|nr:hypothetical protein H5410_062161 [Solanum commersonii]